MRKHRDSPKFNSYKPRISMELINQYINFKFRLQEAKGA